MPSSTAEPVKISVAPDTRVSGLVLAPPRARSAYVFAHGAGAGMAHPFMAKVAEALPRWYREPAPVRLYGAAASALAKARARRGARCRGGGAAVAQTAAVAGGKSFGGRMTSQAGAAPAGCAGWRSFPLHPARRSVARAQASVRRAGADATLQGTRDALAFLDS